MDYHLYAALDCMARLGFAMSMIVGMLWPFLRPRSRQRHQTRT
jgi:hypothetical protein